MVCTKFENMTQGSLAMAKYYLELKQQAERCAYTDAEDSIRTKIIQSMNDTRLRREAMLKSYSIDQILRLAANKEVEECQVEPLENLSVTEKGVTDVKRV